MTSLAVNLCFFSPFTGAPKLGAELISMSSLEPHPEWDSIIIRTTPISSSNMSKTGKNKKKRYKSVITGFAVHEIPRKW
jgi:hypothetical protein